MTTTYNHAEAALGLTQRAPVVASLAKVMAELPGIGKNETASPAQGGYAYRGIEAITRAVQPLLAKHGVVFVPRVEDCTITDITVNGKPWTDTRLTISWTIYGPEDSWIPGPRVVAIGRDNADKGANKAMTQGWKYALLQVLCISDARDDADGTTVESDLPPDPEPPEGWASAAAAADAHSRLATRIKALSERDRGWCQTFRREHGWPMTLDRFEELEGCVADFEAHRDQGAA